MNKNTDNKQVIHINGKAAIAIIVTFALLLACLTVMFVGLAMDAKDTNYPLTDDDDGSGGENGGNRPSKPVSGTIAGKKTGITLPSETPAGVYLCAADENTADINNTAIKSAAVALIDITDGRLVGARNGDARVYPASMTKVMTLLVACENAKDPNALLTVTAQMVEKYKQDSAGASTVLEWVEGYQITVEDALHLVIYDSDTFACWLLADYVTNGKGEQAFVDMMNSKAQSMGLTATKFANCTGLYNENHYTTCRDMAAIMAAVMNNPTATQIITKNTSYEFDIYVNGEKKDTQLTWSDWYTGRLEKYRWGAAGAPWAGDGSDIKIIAGKTGYETVPTCCFVTAAVDSETNRKYVCVQVGRTDKEQDKINAKASTDDTRLVYQKYAVEK